MQKKKKLCVFDSRTRLDGLSDYLIIYYESSGVDANIDDKIREIKRLFIKLYDHYSANYSI